MTGPTPRRAARLAAACVVALAAWLSLTPTPPKPDGLPTRADLAAHLVMHAATAGSLALGWPLHGPGAAVAFALWSEAGQAQVPGRTFSLFDLSANFCGVALGLFARRRAGPALGL